MLSIIVTVHNQLPMNRLFWEHLQTNTEGSWELVVVDNASSDGTREFFKSVGATVVKNNGNYSYPHCQNRGIAAARGEWLAFLNNDVIVPPGWNTRLIETMRHHGMDVMSACGIEKIETPAATKKLKRRWQWIKNLTLLVMGRSETSLRLMHRLMYANWPRFSELRATQFHLQVLEGFVGNTVVMTRRSIKIVGLWDERVQAGDFDLYLRVKKRSLEHGDIRPMHIALDVFVHHYIRLTLSQGYPPFVDRDRLIKLEDKWSPEDLMLLKAANA